MTDFSTYTSILRDHMITVLVGGEEQLAYVIAGALDKVTADDLVDVGSLPDDIDKELVIHNLRLLASAIENGNLL